jgi:hypothetical protein
VRALDVRAEVAGGEGVAVGDEVGRGAEDERRCSYHRHRHNIALSRGLRSPMSKREP